MFTIFCTLNLQRRAPDSLYSRLFDEFQKILKGGILGKEGDMKKAVLRHRIKLLEALEDDPQEILADLILPDAIFSTTGIV